jgi:hypothetical protein
VATEKDRDYDDAQTGYGAADDEADEDTPAQEQQRPEHDGVGDAIEDGKPRDDEYDGPDPEADEKGDGADEDQGI